MSDQAALIVLFASPHHHHNHSDHQSHPHTPAAGSQQHNSLLHKFQLSQLVLSDSCAGDLDQLQLPLPIHTAATMLSQCLATSLAAGGSASAVLAAVTAPALQQLASRCSQQRGYGGSGHDHLDPAPTAAQQQVSESADDCRLTRLGHLRNQTPLQPASTPKQPSCTPCLPCDCS